MSDVESPEGVGCIAVVGMAGRFPGAASVAELWANLRSAVESIRHFEDDELIAAGVSPGLLRESDYVKARGFLEGTEEFDAKLFGFTPREAELMDPQHRLFLESAWAALESAALDPQRFDGRIGVFAGSRPNSYLARNLRSQPDLSQTMGGLALDLGNEADFLTTMVSYKLNLRGPSFDVQTACSTSLVSIHLAVQSLLSQECDVALAGGVSVRVPEVDGYQYVEGGITSPDGTCRAFDANAQGTLNGSGVGVVVLRRLEDAQAEEDPILAIVRGSAINNDGSNKVGFTAPSVDGQAEVIAEALALADVDADTVGMIEAHGTGTALGDPIEVAALKQAFDTSRTQYCALGSVKTNLGHLDAAAGVTGFIKAVLAVQHGEIPPSLHYETPNAEIDFANSPFYVNTQLRDWTDHPRRAGISSFGMGGTNAHVVIEGPPAAAASSHRVDTAAPEVLLLSGATVDAVNASAVQLAAFLEGEGATSSLADVATTLRDGRTWLSHGAAIAATDTQDAVKRLSGRPRIRRRLSSPRLAFLFPGQGAQYAGMARSLIERVPAFDRTFQDCREILRPHLDVDLQELVLASNGEDTDRLRQTQYTQPALFAVEYAMARLLLDAGLEPHAMLGHSIGEYVAACLAGVFSLEDALVLVAERGRLMQSMPPGRMLAVPLSESELVTHLDDSVAIASYNSPELCAVAGATEAVGRLEQRLGEAGIETRPLHTSHAFHTAMMDPILDPFRQKVSAAARSRPRQRFVSNVTGTWITDAEAMDPDYWAQHLRQGVRFRQGVDLLLDEGDLIALEVGPGESLTSLLGQWPTERLAAPAVSTMRHPRRDDDDVRVLNEAMGQLWANGVPMELGKFGAGNGRRLASVPTYPFQHKRYWIERAELQAGPVDFSPRAEPRDWFYVPSWQRGVPPSQAAADPTPPDCWMVLDDGSEMGRAIVEDLRTRARRVLVVQAGARFDRRGDDDFTVTCDDRDHLQRVFDQAGELPRAIVHLWSMGDDLDHALLQRRGFGSLLKLGQVLADLTDDQTVRVEVVTRGLYSVLGHEELTPSRSTLLGPCKVLPQETANVMCRVLDLDMTDSHRQELVLAQLRLPAASETWAFRHGQRWRPTYEPAPLEPSDRAVVRAGGSYLVTGSPRDPVLAVIEQLAARGAASIAWLESGEVPIRENWSEAGLDPARQAQIKRLQAVEQRGCSVSIHHVRWSDASSVQGAVRAARVSHGGLHGVIHAAEGLGQGLIQLKTDEMVAAVFAPKVDATRTLLGVLDGENLDFLVLFSSTVSITGAFGQVDACAANAYLDAVAQSATLVGERVISIDWSPWRQADDPALKEASPQMQSLVAEMRDKYGLDTGEGIDALERVLGAALPQVIVSTHDFNVLVEQPTAFSADRFLQELDKSSNVGMSDRDVVLAEDERERAIASVWEDLFGIAPIGREENFFDLGGNSLLAIQLVSRLRKQFQVELALSVLFEAPTVAQLASRIEKDSVPDDEIAELETLLGDIELLSPDEARNFLEMETPGEVNEADG